MVWTIILFILVLIDQITKIAARSFIEKRESIEVIEDFFYLVNRVNTGAAWSFLANKSWGIYFLSSISFVASIFILFLIYKVSSVKLKIPLVMICAGSVGNLIDRVLYKGVTDFLDFHFGSYVFPTFNFADSLIVCGSILFAIIVISDNNIINEIPFLDEKIPNENVETGTTDGV